jgi:hypothetical protein
MDAVIFICGCGHSGTTLMANMMAAHPDVYTPLRETNVFRTNDTAEAEAGYAALLAEAEASGRRFLVEKTPRHIRCLEMIRGIVPGARFVVAVRDGRDVAASYKRRTGNPQLGINQWIKSNSIVVGQRNHDDLLVYRHEDLIEDPPGTLQRICDFATIPYDEAMLHYHERKQLWFGTQDVVKGDEARAFAQHRNWQVNQPIFDNRGQWRERIAEDEFRDLLRGPGRGLMKIFGYMEGDEPTASQLRRRRARHDARRKARRAARAEEQKQARQARPDSE